VDGDGGAGPVNAAAAVLVLVAALARAQETVYARWPNGPAKDPAFFPIAVWLQDPVNVTRYKAAGFNTYIGLWKGPTEEQLKGLAAAGMRVFCDQNEVGLAHLNDPVIAGWLLGDEPDNAQDDGKGGYGPPVKPADLSERYRRMREADLTRPVMLNLGQGVAWDNWYGRGERTNHPEDYNEYARCGDIVSFDIYPVVHDKPAVRGKLWYVAKGVDRLRRCAAGRVVWNCVEASRIDNEKVKPTAAQIRLEAWSALIHGSQGLIYFVHQFKPTFVEASLLADPDLLPGVTALNRQIGELAPALNAPALEDLEVRADPKRAYVDATARRVGDTVYLFAAEMRPQTATASFDVPHVHGTVQAEVLGEGRFVAVTNGKFIDTFEPFAVHLYKMPRR